MSASKLWSIAAFGLIMLYAASPVAHAQYVLKGQVRDSATQGALGYVNVILSKPPAQVIAFTHTDNGGFFSLKVPDTAALYLEFSYLGYKPKRLPVAQLTETEISAGYMFYLSPEPFDLEEVTIAASMPVSIKKDTVIFDVSYFSLGNEQVVEEILARLPGIQVDEEGRIRVNGQEVERVMVEGDDFFERGYRLLTKNMPAAPIEKVELIERYSKNLLLKDIAPSERIALNLRLKEDAKRIWFGNALLGIDPLANRYESRVNLMNFGKRNKFYALGNLNNTGQDYGSSIEDMTSPSLTGTEAIIGEERRAQALIHLLPQTPGLRQERYNLNNAELLSLNAVLNSVKKLKIKPVFSAGWDESDYFRQERQDYNLDILSFSNTEQYQLRNKIRRFLGKLEANYALSPSETIDLQSRYFNAQGRSASTSRFNTILANEDMQHANTFFDQQLIYTRKIDTARVLLLTARALDERIPQEYRVSPDFFNSASSNGSAAEWLRQTGNTRMEFLGADARFIQRKRNERVLEYRLGASKIKENFRSELAPPAAAPDAASTTLETTDIFFKGRFTQTIRRFEWSTELDAHRLDYSLGFPVQTERKDYWYVNPYLRLAWKFRERNQLRASYSRNISASEILDVLQQPVQTGLRTREQGTGAFNLLASSSMLLHYQSGSWTDKYFFNASVLYLKNHDFFSYRMGVTQSASFLEKILFKDQNILSLQTSADSYLKPIAANLKLQVNHSRTGYQNIINYALQEVSSASTQFGFEVRSGAQKALNYHTGTKLSLRSVRSASVRNTFSEYFAFLDLILTKGPFNAQAQLEHYTFRNARQTANRFWFFDVEMAYIPRKGKVSWSISGKNLFNSGVFRLLHVNEQAVFTTEYRLMPRFLMLKAEYRFS